MPRKGTTERRDISPDKVVALSRAMIWMMEKQKGCSLLTSTRIK